MQYIATDAWEFLCRIPVYFFHFRFSSELQGRFFSLGCIRYKQVYFAGIPLIIEPPAPQAKPPTGKKKGTLTNRSVSFLNPPCMLSDLCYC